MNRLLPYEEIIAQKMEKLPVSDMQDAIWSSIQANLATSLPDVPNDGAGILKEATVSAGKIVTGFIISVIIIAVTVIVVSRKKKAKQNLKTTPEIIQPQVPVLDSSSQKEERKNSIVPFIKTEGDTASQNDISTDTSASIKPVYLPVLKSDSNRLIAPVVPERDTIPKPLDNQPKKKTIGVTGISDSSYRISGKKDSL